MKKLQRMVGLGLIIVSILVLFLTRIYLSASIYTSFFTILFAYVLTLLLPGLLIDLLFAHLQDGIGDSIAAKCGGLEHGGYLIGYAERSLLFLAVLITHYDNGLSFASVLSFLSVIVAGKAIFRYSSRETHDRTCADWYILGTLMSITMALALTWISFRFLLVG